MTKPVSTRLKSRPRFVKSSTAIEIRCHDGPIVEGICQSPEEQGYTQSTLRVMAVLGSEAHASNSIVPPEKFLRSWGVFALK